MTFTKSESADSSPSRGENFNAGTNAVSDTSERFRQDLPQLFLAPDRLNTGEPVQLAHAGHGPHYEYGPWGRPPRGNTESRAESGEVPASRQERARAGDSNLSQSQRQGSSDRASEALSPRQLSEFARNNGLDMRSTPDKKVEFSITSAGQKLIIGNVEATRAGMQEISKSLRELSELKQWDLEERFGVQFAEPKGELRLQQQVPQADGQVKPGKELNLRQATLRELLGIEAGLERANPSHKGNENERPLTFYFLKDGTFYQGAGGIATFEPRVNGGPAVVVEPNSLKSSPVTERDRGGANFRDHRSIESVIIHELGHHTEEKLGLNPAGKAELYRQIGWTPIPGKPTSPDGEQQWMLQGPNGEGYAPASLRPGAWIRYDRNGRERGHITPAEAARLAQVKPSTGYFEGPHEVLAEGLTMLRLGEGHRSHLLNRDASLYRSIRNFDQQELDKSYGTGKYMRSYSGEIVPQNRENQRILREREERERSAHTAQRQRK